ncbi:S-adenosyl-L-methionine-dependent methyltransferase protein [Rutstroemia sp. NJR-2017a WRK4]|nr:S-adenosyl-L-methionine-dependent methyltransferase protein [Rutstroemia sp. NJR-2017a WRK4]
MAGTNAELKDYPAVLVPHMGMHLRRIMVFLTALLYIPPSSYTFDVGCGTGRPVASILSEAGNRVLGIDILETMFEVGDTKIWTCQLREKEGEFDTVFNILSLFILSREEMESMAGHAASGRCGCGGGRFLSGRGGEGIGGRFVGDRGTVTLFTKVGGMLGGCLWGVELDDWRGLVEGKGFEVLVERGEGGEREDLYKLPREADNDDEPYYFVITRKI